MLTLNWNNFLQCFIVGKEWLFVLELQPQFCQLQPYVFFSKHLVEFPKTKFSSYIDDTGTVGADEAGLALAEQLVFDPHHVLLRDSLCDTDSQWYLCINRFDDGSCRKRRRHIDHGGISPCAILSLKKTIKESFIEPNQKLGQTSNFGYFSWASC